MWSKYLFALGGLVAVFSFDDIQRAQLKEPRPHLTRSTPAGIRGMLNQQLSFLASEQKACSEFALENLHELMETLFEMRSDDIIGLYNESDGRTARHAHVYDLRAEHERERAFVTAHPETHDALRDSKCFEATMQWVHHLSDEDRKEWNSLGLSAVPLLPSRGSAELKAELEQQGHDSAAAQASSVVSCETGHNAVAVDAGEWGGYPDWPDEVYYEAHGYGPYPFWYAGSASGGDITGPGTPFKTYWSGIKNAQRFEHSACSTGGSTDGDPCTHLFVGKYAALFGADESWCCWSSTPNLPNCWLSTVERDFYKYFTYNGISEDYTSESGSYTGSVMNYTMALTTVPNFYFWYYTDLDGFPVEQGEGPSVSRPTGGGGVKYLFHQYNRSVFTETSLDWDIFAYPDVCKESTDTCTVSPTNLCDGSG